MGELWFCGDTHGDLGHIIEHVLAAHATGQAPVAIILLGDIDAPRPLHIELEKIRELTEIFWIPGNHDGDDNSAWNNLVSSELSDASLHCRVAQVGPWWVAGVGGIFRRRIWVPPEDPTFLSYEAWRSDLIARRPPKDYRVQFPVMRQNEADTWYDAHGRIVFTASKGLVGVGLPRKAGKRDAPCEIVFPDGKTQSRALGWEDVRKLPDGTRIRRPVSADFLPGGPVNSMVEYVAPFALADREADYQVAWRHFSENLKL